MKVTLGYDEWFPFYELEKAQENDRRSYVIHFEMPDEEAQKYIAMAKKIELMQEALETIWNKQKSKAKELL